MQELESSMFSQGLFKIPQLRLAMNRPWPWIWMWWIMIDLLRWRERLRKYIKTETFTEQAECESINWNHVGPVIGGIPVATLKGSRPLNHQFGLSFFNSTHF